MEVVLGYTRLPAEWIAVSAEAATELPEGWDVEAQGSPIQLRSEVHSPQHLVSVVRSEVQQAQPYGEGDFRLRDALQAVGLTLVEGSVTYGATQTVTMSLSGEVRGRQCLLRPQRNKLRGCSREGVEDARSGKGERQRGVFPGACDTVVQSTHCALIYLMAAHTAFYALSMHRSSPFPSSLPLQCTMLRQTATSAPLSSSSPRPGTTRRCVVRQRCLPD
jgi:hypothetical protein